MTKEDVLERLKGVIDPELGISVVDLGLIYDVAFPQEGKVHVKMTLTTPGCPAAQSLPAGAKAVVEELGGVDEAEVEIVWSPPWHPDMMSDEAKARLGFI